MNTIDRKSVRFSHIFDFLKNKKVGIQENNFSNVDFLIKDICKENNKIKIISYYENNEHYRNIGIENEFVNFNENSEYILIDDMYSFKNHKNFHISQNGIYIYRSNTMEMKDYYLYDVIVEVKNLECGISDLLDGILIIKNRMKVFGKYFFKINDDMTFYYLNENE